MNIGIIGTGNMGGNLAKLWARKNHKIMVTSKDLKQSGEIAVQAGENVSVGSLKDVADFGEVIVFAFPYEAIDEVISKTGSFSGKIIIDIINPLTEDILGLKIGFNTSAAEEIAKKIPGAHVVKAINTIASPVLERGNIEIDANTPTVFYCGDNEDAKSKVSKLISDIGFEPMESGPLTNARYLEPMAEFIVQLAVTGLGANIAYKILK
ncbi:MAG: NADPH-dependent F420 reductase [Ignavibacteriae bacterium]|nr:MAG: NADPH-dependent F420 reductase [Ignavibacteriota bacterium]